MVFGRTSLRLRRLLFFFMPVCRNIPDKLSVFRLNVRYLLLISPYQVHAYCLLIIASRPIRCEFRMPRKGYLGYLDRNV